MINLKPRVLSFIYHSLVRVYQFSFPVDLSALFILTVPRCAIEANRCKHFHNVNFTIRRAKFVVTALYFGVRNRFLPHTRAKRILSRVVRNFSMHEWNIRLIRVNQNRQWIVLLKFVNVSSFTLDFFFNKFCFRFFHGNFHLIKTEIFNQCKTTRVVKLASEWPFIEIL